MEAIDVLVGLTALIVVGVLANRFGRDGRDELDPTFPGFVERPH